MTSRWDDLDKGLGILILQRAVSSDKDCAAVRMVCSRWAALGAMARRHLAPSGLRMLIPHNWGSKFRRLRHLDLSGQPMYLPPLECLGHLSELTGLRISIVQMADTWLESALPLLASSLTSLDMCHSSHLASINMRAVAQLTNLRTLLLSDSTVGGESGMAELAALTRLETLDLSNCRTLTAEGMACLAPLTNLSVLNLSGCDVRDSGMQSLKGLSCLTSISLNGATKLTSAGLCVVGSCPRLRTLEAPGCPLLSDRGIMALSSLKELSTLDLGRWSVSPLSTPYVGHRSDCCHRLTDQSLAAVQHLTNLHRLDLDGIQNFSDSGILHIGNLLLLRHLYFGGCSRVTDNGLVHLSGLVELQDLQLTGFSSITDTGLQYLLSLVKLQSLVLNLCSLLSDGIVPILAQLPVLREVHLHKCHNVSHSAVQSLQTQGKLEVLWYALPNEWVEYNHGIPGNG